MTGRPSRWTRSMEGTYAHRDRGLTGHIVRIGGRDWARTLMDPRFPTRARHYLWQHDLTSAGLGYLRQRETTGPRTRFRYPDAYAYATTSDWGIWEPGVDRVHGYVHGGTIYSNPSEQDMDEKEYWGPVYEDSKTAVGPIFKIRSNIRDQLKKADWAGEKPLYERPADQWTRYPDEGTMNDLPEEDYYIDMVMRTTHGKFEPMVQQYRSSPTSRVINVWGLPHVPKAERQKFILSAMDDPAIPTYLSATFPDVWKIMDNYATEAQWSVMRAKYGDTATPKAWPTSTTASEPLSLPPLLPFNVRSDVHELRMEPVRPPMLP